MKKLLLTLLGALIALPAIAREFTYTYEGQTVTYTVIDEEAKTCSTKAGNWDYPGNNISGDLTLPANPKDGNIEYSLIEIAAYSFTDCRELTSVIIPNSVMSVGSCAFIDCSGLISVFVGSSVKEFGAEDAFKRCFYLKEINVDTDNNYYASANGILYSKDMSKLVRYPQGKEQAEFEIPGSVIEIAENAFFWCSNLISITIPNSVSIIGDYAFRNCIALPSITIPGSVTSIGIEAFAICDNLKEINVASDNNHYASLDGVLYSKDMATLIQYPLGKETTVFEIPNSVVIIGEEAFRNCSRITSVIIGNSVTEIGEWAFQDCDGLTSVTMGNSVEKVGGYAFYSCDNLALINLPNSLTEIGGAAFWRCSSLTSISIPDSVTEIGESAFGFCSELTSVTIPSSVTSIGNSPFRFCRSLLEINVDPENSSYTSDNGILYNKEMSALIQFPPGKAQQEFEIPSSVNEIEPMALSSCSLIHSITIPQAIRYIGGSAFEGCTGLTSVTYLAFSPISSYSYIFDAETYDKATLYYLRPAAEDIAATEPWNLFKKREARDLKGDFCYTYEGQTVTYTIIDEAAKTCRTRIGKSSGSTVATYHKISGDLILPANPMNGDVEYTLVAIGRNSFAKNELTSISIPNTVTKIDDTAFYMCTDLKSVNFPDSAFTIESGAFAYCQSLNSVTIPNSVTKIGSSSFWGCTGLTSITIPNSVTTIGRSVFLECPNLTSITYLSEEPVKGYNNIFESSVYENGTLYYLKSAEEKIAATEPWSLFQNRVGRDAEPTGPRDFEYTYEGQTITYTVIDEEAKTCSTKAGKWNASGNNISGDLTLPANPKDGNIEYSLIEIAQYSFKFCNELTSITIPNSVTEIGREAFYDCTKLATIAFGSSVATIGNGVFANCDGIAEFIVDADNSNFASDNGVLYSKDMGKLIKYPAAKDQQEFQIPNTVTEICKAAFSSCKNLTSVTIPNSVTEIGEYAFDFCSSLTSLSIGNSVTAIGRDAFEFCSALTSITLPNSLTTIGFGAFYSCSGLTSIIIPNSVTSIGEYAFDRCTGLKSVTYLAQTPIKCRDTVFGAEEYERATLYYLKSAEEKIAATEPWSLFQNRVGIDAPDSSISEVENLDGKRAAVYNLHGVRVGESTDGLPKGIYILRNGSTTRKIAI